MTIDMDVNAKLDEHIVAAFPLRVSPMANDIPGWCWSTSCCRLSSTRSSVFQETESDSVAGGATVVRVCDGQVSTSLWGHQLEARFRSKRA